MHIVVQLENTQVKVVLVDTSTEPIKIIDTISFPPDLTDESGKALFQSIDAKVKGLVKKTNRDINIEDIPACIVMPGSLSAPDTVVRSSRLNIREECTVRDCVSPSSPRYRLINDVTASAYGHAQYSLDDEIRKGWKDKLLLFVYVNEGVGSFTLSNSMPLAGAGFAGPLGHAIVEPKGQYFDDFRARGALETYCSRPWMSANIVNRYHTEIGKKQVGPDAPADGTFVRALQTMSLPEKMTLPYAVIDQGIKEENSIAISVLNEATDYLGWTLSHLIVSINPHLIVLDGQMVHDVRGFFDQTVRATRRYTWVDAWNATRIVSSQNSPEHAVYGAIAAQENTND